MLENQADFRRGYATNDHIFTLKCLIDLYLSKKKKLFCALVDFRNQLFQQYNHWNRIHTDFLIFV